MNIQPTFPKPPYYEAFDLIAGLPLEVKANVCALLLRIWRHTNSDQSHTNYGKAWVSQIRMAAEMHLGRSTVAGLFDDAWDLGFISREHHFKKNGQVNVSIEPYTKATSHGTGEYLGSRYWVNWTAVRTAQAPKQLEIGVPETGTPNPNGLPENITPNPIGVPDSRTPVPETGTKGCIKGSPSLPIRCATMASPSSESTSSTGDDNAATAAASKTVVVGVGSGLTPCGQKERDVVAETAAPESSIPIFPTSVTEEPPETTEVRSERLVSETERRQSERHRTDSEIYHEFKSVFDRLRRQSETYGNYPSKYIMDAGQRVPNPAFDSAVFNALPHGIGLSWTSAKPAHQKKAAALYRAIGRDAVLAAWERYLLDGDHEVPQPIRDEEGKVIGSETVQRDWLLLDFVQEHENLAVQS